jgi:signal transduction histidine kinase/CheY-like chemotaxis protein
MAMVLENARLFRDAQDRLSEITALHRRYLHESYEDFVPTRPRTEYTFTQPGVSEGSVLSTVEREIEQVLAENRPLAVVGNGSTGLAGGGVHEPSSTLLAPIPLREYVLGALGLQEIGEEREWTQDDIALVDAVTEQMAMAIDNARLFEETERRTIELEQIAQELRETDKFRAQFLANMSHELRTPLNSIIGFSRVILKGIDGPLTEFQKTDLEAIYSNGQHLLQMINDILDMSKIEAGKMELVIENVDMNVLIKGVVSTSNALVRDKPVEFQTEIEADLPIIRADGTRLRQVITNLVSNAAKFTNEGSISLCTWRDEVMVYVSVEDTGEGIPEDKMSLVFEAFRQADSSSTRRAEGTGLGLPISRQFIEMHGGRIWVESQVGKGSTFTFCVPIEGPVEEVAELVDLEIDETKKMLLVIERDEVAFSAYQGALDGDGYQMVGLYDGRNAVRWARYLRPWAILMDVQLDDDLGWEALESLKSTRATREVPVIVCSAVEEGGRAITMGAAAHLPKPLVAGDLVETLGRLQR